MRQILTKRSLIGLGLALAPISLMFWPLGGAAQAAAADSPSPKPSVTVRNSLPVYLQEVQAVHSWTESTQFTGTIAARRSSDLGFERAGHLLEVAVEQGSIVEQGQILARLDIARLQVQRAEAAAALAIEDARLQEAIAGPRPQTLLQAKAEVERQDAEVERLESEARRRQELLERGVSAEEEAESLAFAARAARASREAAQQRLAELEAGTRVEQLAALRASRDLAQARLAQFDLEIERSSLRAPYAGTIVERMVDEGVVLNRGTPVLRLQERAAAEARIGVPEAIAEQLSTGQILQLSVASKAVDGVLRAALPMIDSRTRSRTLVLDLKAAHALPGMTANWTAQIPQQGEGHSIPATALVPSRRGLWAVYLYDNGTLRRQDVSVLHANSETVIVLGLREGDQVVGSGTDRVVPGQAVHPHED